MGQVIQPYLNKVIVAKKIVGTIQWQGDHEDDTEQVSEKQVSNVLFH